MSLTATQRDLLNKFAQSQPALKDTTKPYPASQLALGDALDTQGLALDSALYSFAIQAGGVGAHTLPSITFPKGSIITGVWTDTLTALTSGGSATVALSVGGVTLVSATAFDSYTGVQYPGTLPVKTTAAGKLTLTVAVAALTAGKLKVYVNWIKPS